MTAEVLVWAQTSPSPLEHLHRRCAEINGVQATKKGCGDLCEGGGGECGLLPEFTISLRECVVCVKIIYI